MSGEALRRATIESWNAKPFLDVFAANLVRAHLMPLTILWVGLFLAVGTARTGAICSPHRDQHFILTFSARSCAEGEDSENCH